MIVSTRRLIALGILTFVIGIIALFPARVAVHWMVPDAIPISGIEGTVWSGSAAAATVEGIYLRDIEWQMQPLRLLRGQLSYRIGALPISGFIESEVNVGFGGAISMNELTASVPLSLFASVIGVRGLEGTASVTLQRLEVIDGLATAADGTVQIAGLIVPEISRTSLGGYKADFFTQNNGIGASLEDTDGVIDLAGSLQIRADRSYNLVGLVAAKPAAPDRLTQQLQSLPAANDRGQREIRLEGIL